jgi:hypothetical protein
MQASMRTIPPQAANSEVEEHMTERVDAGWSVREFHGLDLGDTRLNRRLLIMAEAFGAQPAAPINQASADWQDTKAAHAFFARERALPAEIVLPHQQRTRERMAAHACILAREDTSFLNYAHHPATSGLGPIGGGQRGLVMHSTLAFTPQRLPLGLLDQQIWARPEPERAAKRTKQRPIADKESHTWLSALRERVRMTPSAVRLVTIADREADIFAFLAEADELEAEYVIRAAQDRRLSGEAELLWAHMATQAVVGTVTVEVAARGAKPARRADLLVRVAHITLQPPRRAADDPGIWLEPLPVWAIWLHEERPPEGVESLDWLLLTNVAIATWLDATERIGYSCVRPGIESWHNFLKSGWSVEDGRLEEAERLKPYVALMGVVAWRLFWLTHINRQTPAAPCTTILAEHEWKARSTTIHRSPTIPAVAPSVRQAVRSLAQLGGFLGLLATVSPALPRSGADGHG